MADEPQKPAPPVTTDPVVPEKPAPTTDEVIQDKEQQVVVEPDKVVDNKISQSVSFKEETNVVADLPDAQKKALDDLKNLLQEALNKHELTAPPPPKVPPPQPQPEEDVAPKAEAEAEEKEEQVIAKVEEEAEKKEEQVIAKVEAEAEKKEEQAEAEKKVEQVIAEAEKKVEEAEAEAEKKEEQVLAEAEKKEEQVIAEAEKKEAAVEVEVTEEKKEAEEVDIWGIPLMGDERSEVILLKFLRARDFKVKDAFSMIKNTVRWRKDFGIDGLLEEDLGTDWDKVVFTHGHDKEGHPVCYNVFGEFDQKTVSEEEKRNKFIRWRIQLLEKSVRTLDFSPKGISTIVQVNDLKNSPGLGRQATNQALQLLQDNYPEFVAKQIFINVPWWYLAFSRMISPFLTQRTKSKFVFAGPSKSAETLFKYIAPEQVPLQYGGLSRDGEQEFTTADPVTEVTIKPATKHAVEFPFSEKGHLVWEIRVVGWDVNYGAEFVPTAEDGYTVIVHKTRKVAPADETVITSTFKIGEPGKVILTIDNQTSKKKKLLYRSKTKPIQD